MKIGFMRDPGAPKFQPVYQMPLFLDTYVWGRNVWRTAFCSAPDERPSLRRLCVNLCWLTAARNLGSFAENEPKCAIFG
jgi:hypothetical protein